MNRSLVAGLALACWGALAAGAPAAPAPAAEAQKPVVEFKTSLGTFQVELYPDKAPITVKNFLGYVDDKFYDGTIFHRVIPGFMAQGGGFEPGMKQKDTKDPIKNESGNGLSNLRGTIAMARLPEPDTATAQFYINVADNAPLDAAEGKPGYAVFGKVISGMDVVDKIVKVEAGTRAGHRNVPVRDVVIKSVRRVK